MKKLLLVAAGLLSTVPLVANAQVQIVQTVGVPTALSTGSGGCGHFKIGHQQFVTNNNTTAGLGSWALVVANKHDNLPVTVNFSYTQLGPPTCNPFGVFDPSNNGGVEALGVTE